MTKNLTTRPLLPPGSLLVELDIDELAPALLRGLADAVELALREVHIAAVDHGPDAIRLPRKLELEHLRKIEKILQDEGWSTPDDDDDEHDDPTAPLWFRRFRFDGLR